MKKLFLSLALALGIFAIPLPSFATVSSTTNTVQYSGDGHSTSFSFNNNVYLASDLNVYEVTAGVSTLLTLNTNYSVSLTAISGVTGAYTATINLAGGSSPAGALAIGTTLAIVRNIPYTQLINISDDSATPAATWNQAHDRGVILSQQLLNLVNRSILQSVTATTPITFPPPVASNMIGWDVTGTILQNYVPNTSTYISLPLAASQGGTGSASITFPLATANGGTGSTANANAANGVATYASNGNFGIGTTSPSKMLCVGSTCQASIDSSGNILGTSTTQPAGDNSTKLATTAYADASTLHQTAKAWANFYWSGSAVVINASYNVSSITRNSAGTYNVNLTNALTDAYGAVVANAQDSTTLVNSATFGNVISSSQFFVYHLENSAGVDCATGYPCSVVVFR
jgi:hypothetical protein